MIHLHSSFLLLTALMLTACSDSRPQPDVPRLEKIVLPDVRAAGVPIPDDYRLLWGYTPQQEVGESGWKYIIEFPISEFQIPKVFSRSVFSPNDRPETIENAL